MWQFFSNKYAVFKHRGQNPFHLRLSSVSPIKPGNQDKIGAFLVCAGNKTYKMRVCKNKKKAKKIEQMIYIFPDCFPHFYGRSGKNLLFDWVGGNFIDKIELTNAISFKVGAMMGKANSLHGPGAPKTFDAYISNKVERLNRHHIFNHNETVHILDVYKQLGSDLGVVLVPELRDMHCRNLIVTEENLVYFIDEQGFRISVRGLGLVKPLLTENMIHGESNLDSFWEGYRQYCPSQFFSREYQLLLRSIEMLNLLRGSAKTNPNIENLKNVFFNLLNSISA